MYIGNIKYLYELRKAVNVFDDAEVAQRLGCSSNIVTKLYESTLRGSSSIAALIKLPESELDDEILKLHTFDREEEKNKNQAARKNEQLIHSLYTKRKTFCDLGTNKVKRRLNKRAKTDVKAQILRLALEIEDKNIQAKETPYAFKSKVYGDKYNLISQLVEIYQTNGLIFGIQEQKERNTNHVIYFEIDEYQISWHIDLVSNEYPLYTKQWDGLTNSTLDKLEILIKRVLYN